jgi:hypothetical protein
MVQQRIIKSAQERKGFYPFRLIYLQNSFQNRVVLDPQTLQDSFGYMTCFLRMS